MSKALEDVRQGLRVFNVLSYGAVPTTGTDSTAAIQAAIDACEAEGGGTVYFPPGSYKTTATLTVTLPITLKGANCRAVILQVSHVAGPAITFGDYFSGVEDMQIQGSDARLTAANTADVGVRFLRTAARAMFGNFVRRCIINNHGGNAIHAENCPFLVVEDSRIDDIGGHGIYGDSPTIDTDNPRFGICEIKNTQIVDCVGHSICMGVTNYAFRVTLDNVDMGPCAQAAGIRQSAYNAHLVVQNLIARNCAFEGHDGEAIRTATIGGAYINGRSPLVEACRFIDVLTTAVSLGADSDGARILDNQLTGDVQATLDPAVLVDAACSGVYVRWGLPTLVGNPMTVAPANSGNRSEWYSISPQGFRSALQGASIADDAVHTFTFTGVTYGIMAISSNSGAAKTCLISFRVGDGSAYCTLLAGDATDITVGTGVLSGTTGTDAKLNFSSGTASPVLYIENRQGSSFNFMPTFLSLGGLAGGGELDLS